MELTPSASGKLPSFVDLVGAVMKMEEVEMPPALSLAHPVPNALLTSRSIQESPVWSALGSSVDSSGQILSKVDGEGVNKGIQESTRDLSSDVPQKPRRGRRTKYPHLTLEERKKLRTLQNREATRRSRARAKLRKETEAAALAGLVPNGAPSFSHVPSSPCTTVSNTSAPTNPLSNLPSTPSVPVVSHDGANSPRGSLQWILS